MDAEETEWDDGRDRSGSGSGQVAGFCKCDNELSDSIKFGKFLD